MGKTSMVDSQIIHYTDNMSLKPVAPNQSQIEFHVKYTCITGVKGYLLINMA